MTQFDKLSAFSKKVTDLPDVPSPGLTPTQIKSYFQTPSDELQTSFNNLIDGLNEVMKQPTTELGVQAKLGDHDAKLAENVKVITGLDKTGVNDEKTTVQNVVNSSCTLRLSKGNYKISELTIPAGVTVVLIGDGSKNTIIKTGHIVVLGKLICRGIKFLNDESKIISNNAESVDGSGAFNITETIMVGQQSYKDLVTLTTISERYEGAEFYECEFDYLNDTPGYYAYSIRCHNASTIIVDHCKIYKAGIEYRYVTNHVTSNNLFDMKYVNQTEPIHNTMDVSGVIIGNTFTQSQTDHIDTYPSSHELIISDNKFLHKRDTMIEIKIHLEDADIQAVSNFNGHIANLIISNNIFLADIGTGIEFIRIAVFDNRTNKSTPENYYNDGIIIDGNIFSFFGQGDSTTGCPVILVDGMYNVAIKNNIFKGKQNINPVTYALKTAYTSVKNKGYNHSFIGNTIKFYNGAFGQTYVENVDGFIMKDNIFDFGDAGRQATTSYPIYLKDISNAIISNNTIKGAKGANAYTDYYLSNVKGFIDTPSNGYTVPSLYGGRISTVTGGYRLCGNFCEVNVQATITATMSGMTTVLLNLPSPLGNRTSTLACFDQTGNKTVPCTIVYDSGNAYGVIQLSGVTANDVVIITGRYEI